MGDVSTPSAEYERLAKKWSLPRTLMGGTRAMREAGKLYLPQEPAESGGAYADRLARSTLFNAFRKTVADMTGKVFRHEIALGEDVPQQIVGYVENIDLTGRHLNVFARDCFFDAMQPGIGFILTDMQQAVAGATRAAEQQAGLRPYLCYLRAEDVIGWKTDYSGGVVRLTQVRIRERTYVPDGEYAEVEIPQIRVLTPGGFEIWQPGDPTAQGSQWVKIGEGATSLDVIPIAPVYINRTGVMSGEPPLEDLADLNVAHWQEQSDLRTIAHVVNVPILFGAGFSADDPVVIGPSSMTRTTDPNAKMQFVTHDGAAIGQTRELLKDLEFQMQMQGLQLLIAQPGGKTATGEMRDSEKENTPLAMMATALGDALELSFGFMAQFLGLGRDAGGSLKVNTDFGVNPLAAQNLALLADMTKNRIIAGRTWWAVAQQNDVVPDSMTWEDNEQYLAEEALGGGSGVGAGDVIDVHAMDQTS